MRKAGLPVDVLAEYVRLAQQGDQTAEARREILIEQRERILAKAAEIQEVVRILDQKIEVYDLILLKGEQNLTKEEIFVE